VKHGSTTALCNKFIRVIYQSLDFGFEAGKLRPMTVENPIIARFCELAPMAQAGVLCTSKRFAWFHLISVAALWPRGEQRIAK
jgi:hypothetical protein